jgi:hypothetical protein
MHSEQNSTWAFGVDVRTMKPNISCREPGGRLLQLLKRRRSPYLRPVFTGGIARPNRN